MKPQRVLIHANCARVAMQALLKRMHPALDIRTTYNVSKDGAEKFRELVTTWRPHVLLFQEHKLERAEAFIPGQGFPAFVQFTRKRIPTVSWVHPHNLALWPWATKTAADMIDKGVSTWKTCTRLVPEEAARIRAQADHLDEAKIKWKNRTFDFNFDARLAATQAHHDANEALYKPPVITGPWLKENFKRERLWWSCNHPTAAVHLEITRQICHRLGWPFKPEVVRDLPGDWVGADGAWPHSVYDHAHFGFNFCTEDLARSADCFWLGRLREIFPG